MRLGRLIAAIAAWTACAVVPFAFADDASDIDAAENATVRVAVIVDAPEGRSLFGTGSGFVVAPGVVVTNAHVVAAARQHVGFSVSVVAPSGEGLIDAEIVRYSTLFDLALLQVKGGPEIGPVTLSTRTPKQGDSIIALGYPDVDDLRTDAAELVRPVAPSRTAGAIASLRDRAPTGDPIPTINHAAAISSGSSGGPLLDECGRVIGVNTWHARGSDTGEGRGVAARASVLVEFLREAGIEPKVTETRCLSVAERVAAEQANTVDVLKQQNLDLAAKLDTADRLIRIAFVILIGAAVILFATVFVLAAVLGAHREAKAEGTEVKPPRHHGPGGILFIVIAAGLAVAAAAAVIIYLRPEPPAAHVETPSAPAAPAAHGDGS